MAPVSWRPAVALVTIYCCYDLYAGSTEPAVLAVFGLNANNARRTNAPRSARRVRNNSLPPKVHKISLAVQHKKKALLAARKATVGEDGF